MTNVNETIGAHWSSVTETKPTERPLKLRWWQSGHIVQHVNSLVCGQRVPGFSQGLINIVKERARHSIPFRRGISVGGGLGQKEINLINQGIVESFDLYELSKSRIKSGRQLAEKQSVDDKITFIYGDAFELVTDAEQYDFVHWNNSLHHMLDVDQAVKWSRKVLKRGGLFYMDDYIGAARLQWPDEQMEIATKVRRVFAESKYLFNPKVEGSFLATAATRLNKEILIATDPSEAAESDKIIEAIYRYFPAAEIQITGGVIYHLALADMIHNFDEGEDKLLLDLLMIIDELCAELGQTHYGTALAFKD